jgi:hypothetical protein
MMFMVSKIQNVVMTGCWRLSNLAASIAALASAGSGERFLKYTSTTKVYQVKPHWIQLPQTICWTQICSQDNNNNKQRVKWRDSENSNRLQSHELNARTYFLLQSAGQDRLTVHICQANCPEPAAKNA